MNLTEIEDIMKEFSCIATVCWNLSCCFKNFYFKKKAYKGGIFVSSQPSSEIVSRMLASYGMPYVQNTSNFVGLDIPHIKEHMIQTINASNAPGSNKETVRSDN